MAVDRLEPRIFNFRSIDRDHMVKLNSAFSMVLFEHGDFIRPWFSYWYLGRYLIYALYIVYEQNFQQSYWFEVQLRLYSSKLIFYYLISTRNIGSEIFNLMKCVITMNIRSIYFENKFHSKIKFSTFIKNLLLNI